MKTNLFTFFLLILIYLPSNSQTVKMDNSKLIITEIQDRIAIKNVVDTFSILADQKDITKQIELFTEDAIVESHVQGQPTSRFLGRKQIGDAFGSFLNNFDVVYHINGQQTVTLKGDIAHGISYCLVTLIGNVNEKKMKTTLGVYYNDDFVKKENQWFISKRVSTFVWQDRRELITN